MSYSHDNRLEILLRPAKEFGDRNDVAIHVRADSVRDFIEYVDQADKDNFDLIVVYSDNMNEDAFSGAAWGELKELLPDADIRLGQIQRQYGQVLGQGFTLFDWR